MNILGISCFYHDAAAALLVDGQLVAAASEERFSRLKHDPELPAGAAKFCLQKAGLVTRVPDESDRRRQVLELTEEAEGVLRSVRSRRTAWLAERLERLEPEELAAIEAALDPLSRLLEAGE